MEYKANTASLLDLNLLDKQLLHQMGNQLNSFYRYIWVEFWGNLMIATILSIYLWSGSDHLLLIAWFIAFQLVNLARLLYDNQYCKIPDLNFSELEKWGNLHIFFTVLIGGLWGLVSVILYPVGSLVHQVYLLIAILGIDTISIVTLANNRNSYAVYLAFVSLPLIFQFLLENTLSYSQLAFFLFVIISILLVVSYYLCEFMEQNQELQAQFHKQAHTDALTHLPNRRYFDRSFKQEWLRSARDQKYLSLLLVDIDHFKYYNDAYGHLEGDRCLAQVAVCMSKAAKRAADMSARLGGEEFVLLLPSTSLDDAMIVAERLRVMIEKLALPHKDSPISDVITVSIGVASCKPTPVLTKIVSSDEEGKHNITYPAMLFAAADRAMYCAKQGGRNRISLEDCGHHLIIDEHRQHSF